PRPCASSAVGSGSKRTTSRPPTQTVQIAQSTEVVNSRQPGGRARVKRAGRRLGPVQTPTGKARIATTADTDWNSAEGLPDRSRRWSGRLELLMARAGSG